MPDYGIGTGRGYGYGYGYGTGYGYGHGYGYVYGYGRSYGRGYGCGYGDGHGRGDGYGTGHGYGVGVNYGDGYSVGHGDGDGHGYGVGEGYGYGYGTGYGEGEGYGYGSDCGATNGAIYTVSHETPIIAYHYVRDDMRLHHPHNGQHVRVEVGTVLEIDREPEMCKRGLHASLTPEDARQYAGVSGVLTRVACSGHVVHGRDKLVCTRREVLEVHGA